MRFRGVVPRTRMKELMRRSDGPAIRDTVIRIGLNARLRLARHRDMGELVGSAVLPRLWCVLPIGTTAHSARSRCHPAARGPLSAPFGVADHPAQVVQLGHAV